MKTSPTKALGVPPFSLAAIYLRESSAAIRQDFDPLLPGQSVQIVFQFKPLGYAHKTEQQRFVGRFLVEFKALYFAQNEPINEIGSAPSESEAVAAIRALYEADYALAADASVPNDAQMEAWGQTTLMHTWPYWREFCHTTMTRMSLPQILVPLLVVNSVQIAPKAKKGPRAPKT